MAGPEKSEPVEKAASKTDKAKKLNDAVAVDPKKAAEEGAATAEEMAAAAPEALSEKAQAAVDEITKYLAENGKNILKKAEKGAPFNLGGSLRGVRLEVGQEGTLMDADITYGIKEWKNLKRGEQEAVRDELNKLYAEKKLGTIPIPPAIKPASAPDAGSGNDVAEEFAAASTDPDAETSINAPDTTPNAGSGNDVAEEFAAASTDPEAAQAVVTSTAAPNAGSGNNVAAQFAAASTDPEAAQTEEDASPEPQGNGGVNTEVPLAPAAGPETSEEPESTEEIPQEDPNNPEPEIDWDWTGGENMTNLGKALDLKKDTTEPPEAKKLKDQLGGSDTVRVVTQNDPLRIRAENGEKLGLAPKGSELQLVLTNGNPEVKMVKKHPMVKVKKGDLEGYVSLHYVEAVKKTAEAPAEKVKWEENEEAEKLLEEGGVIINKKAGTITAGNLDFPIGDKTEIVKFRQKKDHVLIGIKEKGFPSLILEVTAEKISKRTTDGPVVLATKVDGNWVKKEADKAS